MSEREGIALTPEQIRVLQETGEVEASMTERPILFSGPMVQAILEGRKTMTRRVVKNIDSVWERGTPEEWMSGNGNRPRLGGYPKDRPLFKRPDGLPMVAPAIPYPVGTRLWVRETWREYNNAAGVLYRATDTWADHPINGVSQWRPSIHMPRWASRITLEVTALRLERLQQITEEDARAEGVASRDEFMALWDRINDKTYRWESNPYVWVVGFRVP